MTKSQAVAIEMQTRLRETEFEGEISPEFIGYFRKALSFCSMQKAGVQLLTWRNFITFERKFLMPEIGIAIMILEGASPKELDQTLESNLIVHDKIIAPVKEAYEKIVTKIENQSRAAVDTRAKMGQPLIPTGSGIYM